MDDSRLIVINPLSANPTKWPNTLEQFVGNFDYFAKLALKGLIFTTSPFQKYGDTFNSYNAASELMVYATKYKDEVSIF